MLASAEFAGWIVSGVNPRGGPADSRSEPERFAEHELQVMNRTNGFKAAGGKPNLPWPRALGTPPWGAARELEAGAARPGAAYRMRLLRLGSAAALRHVYQDLAGLVGEGLPALLYVGSPSLPRHVTLLLPGSGTAASDDTAGSDGTEGTAGSEAGTQLDVYDPATGTVTGLSPDRFASRTLGIAGWNVPWIAVQPR